MNRPAYYGLKAVFSVFKFYIGVFCNDIVQIARAKVIKIKIYIYKIPMPKQII